MSIQISSREAEMEAANFGMLFYGAPVKPERCRWYKGSGATEWVCDNEYPAYITWRGNVIEPPGKFKLYHIRFDAVGPVNSEGTGLTIKDSSLPEGLADILHVGYIGVTGRPLAARFREHYQSAVSNSGYALHGAWHEAMRLEGKGQPSFMVYDSVDTLPAVYDLEERSVDLLRTLAPRGLNVIPGGYAGIRMMHELGLTNKKKLGPEEREQILTTVRRAAHTNPRFHYRVGHVRRLSPEKTTWVRECFVGGKALHA